jgi:cAMP-dependent protein kinase regulator
MVIKQGDDGNELFVVESGKLECSKVFNPKDPPRFLKHYGPGEAFGELSLLYNTPRAASIKALTPVVCWVLDRDCFNHIVKDAAVKKREKYETILQKVDILSSVEPYEKMQIADALKSVTFQSGEYVIRQGDWGDVFYMIAEGTAVALKSYDGLEEKEVKIYEEGSYFGELSLIKGQARAASIRATSYLKCVTLDRKAFRRMLGPIEELMKRKALEYN